MRSLSGAKSKTVLKKQHWWHSWQGQLTSRENFYLLSGRRPLHPHSNSGRHEDGSLKFGPQH
jgi:hypothetical protein